MWVPATEIAVEQGTNVARDSQLWGSKHVWLVKLTNCGGDSVCNLDCLSCRRRHVASDGNRRRCNS